MPQTVLGLSGAVVGAFREAFGVFRGAKFFGYQYFKMSTTGVLATEIDRCECIENTGTTKSVRKKFLNGKSRSIPEKKKIARSLKSTFYTVCPYKTRFALFFGKKVFGGNLCNFFLLSCKVVFAESNTSAHTHSRRRHDTAR